jgi:hypothetical protein
VRYEQVVTNPWVLFAKDGVNSWQRRDLFWRLRPGIEVSYSSTQSFVTH